MGLLNSSLHIGRTAILGYQNALQIVGSNISSAGSPDYTRLTPQLNPLQGSLRPDGMQPGAGVTLTGIRRHVDEGIESRLRLASGDVESATVALDTLQQLEAYFDDTTGNDLGTRLADLFHAFDDLQNNPSDPATRDLLLSRATHLAESFATLRNRLGDLRAAADGQIPTVVEQADELAREIARLNEQVSESEGFSTGQATSLRDRRDALLRELGKLASISVRTQEDGTMNVYLGSETLVQGNRSRGLTVVEETTGSTSATAIRFTDTLGDVPVRGGRLGGLLEVRERFGVEEIEALDQLAGALIESMNRLHADGQGLVGYRSLVGGQAVQNPSLPLNDPSQNLPFPPSGGSFFLTVIDDATGSPVATRIDINADPDTGDSLEDLAANISAQVTGVTASVTPGNHLALTADDGLTFTLGFDGQQQRADTSGVLASLGVNTFWAGSSAADIRVRDDLVADTRMIAAGGVFLPGDGSTAGRMAALDEQALPALSGRSVLAAYNAISGGVAVAMAGAQDDVEANRGVFESLLAQRESISGVSLDEEAIALVKYERAFQGAARFLRTVDQMIQELVTLLN
jgi:flagellar hook-associated protein 1 FlgK